MAQQSADNIIPSVKEKMQNAVEAMRKELAGLRTGKASPALVEDIEVQYYGTSTRLRDIAGITAPEPRQLVIQPWDQNAIKDIEKAIQASELGISPVNDGRVIRLPIPELTEDRRQELVKLVRDRAESTRVEVRNARREANDKARKAQKASEITEDDLKDMEREIQELTDTHIGTIDEMVEEKEKDLMQS